MARSRPNRINHQCKHVTRAQLVAEVINHCVRLGVLFSQAQRYFVCHAWLLIICANVRQPPLVRRYQLPNKHYTSDICSVAQHSSRRRTLLVRKSKCRLLYSMGVGGDFTFKSSARIGFAERCPKQPNRLQVADGTWRNLHLLAMIMRCLSTVRRS